MTEMQGVNAHTGNTKDVNKIFWFQEVNVCSSKSYLDAMFWSITKDAASIYLGLNSLLPPS